MSTGIEFRHLSEEQIDGIVIAQAEDDAAWEKPVLVHRDISTALPLPPELVTRAAFFARLHKMPSVEEWLRSIIEERIDFEEAAFAGLKQALAAKSTA
jgi:hypothetical protein